MKDNLDPTDGLLSFTEARRTPSAKQSEYITSNSSLSSILPFKAQQQQSTASDDLSAINPLPLQSNLYSRKSTNNNLDQNLLMSQDTHNSEVVEVISLQNEVQTVGLQRAKKSPLMSSLNDNTIVTNAQMHINGFINRRGIRKGLVTSSLMVGAVQRKDVDTEYTCLASNSNMTQASRAAVKLQMNRE